MSSPLQILPAAWSRSSGTTYARLWQGFMTARVILALAILYSHFAAQPQVAGALRGMGAVAGGLIAAVGVKLLPQLRKHVLGFVPCLVLAAVVVLAIAWFRVPLAWVLLVVGGVACGLTWRKLTP